MRRNSCTWLFSGLLLLGVCVQPAAAQRPTVCLPPINERGARLLEPGSFNTLWLQLLLRQHEVCWRAADHWHELRVFLYGNSAIFGHPLPVEETVGHLLNQRIAAAGLPAHVFNLGMVFTYQVKDALIIHESLKYQPDVIIYGVTLSEFDHIAPTLWPPLINFFESNNSEMIRFAEQRPVGLAEPLEKYRLVLSAPRGWYVRTVRHIREAGALTVTAIRNTAKSARSYLLPSYQPAPDQTDGRQRNYDCDKTRQEFRERFANWRAWNILAYLQQIQDTSGVAVLIVNWPVANEPVGDCYNVRYPKAALEEYNAWITDQARARGLHYVDLHNLLQADDFVDSLHVSARGHKEIAERLAPDLESLLATLIRARRNPLSPAN